MKLLAYADVHMRDCGSFPPFNMYSTNGLTHETNNILRGCAFVRDTIEKTKPDTVVFLGDWYHNIDSIPVTALHATSIGLSTIWNICKNMCIKHYLLTGNHDMYANAIFSVTNLAGYFDEIVTKPIIYDVKGISVGFLPYGSRSFLYSKIYEMISGSDVLLTHCDYNGAKYENGFVVTDSLDPVEDKVTLSGHVHVSQTIGKVNYCGSIVQNKFFTNNYKNCGGSIQYNSETNKVKWFKNTYSKHYVKIKGDNFLEEIKKNSLDPEHCVLFI